MKITDYDYISGNVPNLGGNVTVMSVTGPHLKKTTHRFQQHELPAMVEALEQGNKTARIDGKSKSVTNYKLNRQKFQFSCIGVEVTIEFTREGSLKTETVKQQAEFVPPGNDGDLYLIRSWETTLTKRPEIHNHLIHLADTKHPYLQKFKDQMIAHLMFTNFYIYDDKARALLALEKASSNLEELRTRERLRQVEQAQEKLREDHESLREDHDTFKTDTSHKLSELQEQVQDLMKDKMGRDGGNDGGNDGATKQPPMSEITVPTSISFFWFSFRI